MNFAQTRFLGSFLEKPPQFRSKGGALLSEIAVVGRSNVGKSSLINHLLNHKGIARVSSTPGKTQTVNFFNVDDHFVLADLPGYGFAKRSKELRHLWSEAIDRYLEERPSLKLVLFLLDIRRAPSEDDLAFVQWADHHRKPLLLILTKSDTLSQHEREQNKNTILGALGGAREILSYSIREGLGRKQLRDKIAWVIS